MRIADEVNMLAATKYHGRHYKGPYNSETASKCSKAAPEDNASVLLDLSEDALSKADTEKGSKTGDKEHRLAYVLDEFAKKRAEKEENKGSGDLDDPTARLTKRLVASKTRDEVLTIMSEAYKALGEALKAAGSGDEEAIEVVRRLQKLIKRVSRKMKDLDGEANMSRKEERAKKQELEQLAMRHKMELERRIAERKKREKKYLEDPDAQDEEEQVKISFGSMSKEELEALMRQMMPAVMSELDSDADMSGMGDFSDAQFCAGSLPGDISSAETGEGSD